MFYGGTINHVSPNCWKPEINFGQSISSSLLLDDPFAPLNFVLHHLPKPHLHLSSMSNNSNTHARRRSVFRPCIDLHEGKVKQIVGGTLDLLSAGESSTSGSGSATGKGSLRTNFVSE